MNRPDPALVHGVDDAPEPLAPQGEYAPGGPVPEIVVPEPAPAAPGSRGVTELLAPAGGLESGYAAFHYGADAIYLGMKKFSARAEAQNFTMAEIDAITAFAHGLPRRRQVFVTVNTVIRQDELREMIECLGDLEAIGVDALIIQDLGVYRLVRRHFPRLTLHGSTQLAVHNLAGARALAKLGFTRVVLARELTFEEIREIAREGGIETEVFVHGALCYAYSGLCLFSSQTLGRSGNRGQCAYSCRDSYTTQGAPPTLKDGTPTLRDPAEGFPFSMKDLALPDHVDALRDAGVACFKIEGRKKGALYTAASTDYYRKLLDGKMAEAERPDYEADLQTIFSRPWTRLFVRSHRDKEVADRDTVGHRGSRIGKVERVVSQGGGTNWLRFRTARRIERHDGIQVDLPRLGRPFGFPIGELRVVEAGRRSERQAPTYEAPAGALVELLLPREHPTLPEGADVYCASSQVVKQRYKFPEPKPDRSRCPVVARGELAAEGLRVELAVADGRAGARVEAYLPGPFEPARDPAKAAAVLAESFAKLGDTPFTLEAATLANPEALAVPVSKLNAMRRRLAEDLAMKLASGRQATIAAVVRDELPPPPTPVPGEPRWSIKVDRLAFLDGFEAEDFAGVDEVVVDIARDGIPELLAGLERLAGRVGRDALRLALPAVTRRWENAGLRSKIARLRAEGYAKWEGSNVSVFDYLDLDPLHPVRGPGAVDLATDWAVYVVNRPAALQAMECGATRFALSPEDGLANMAPLLAEFPDRAVVIVHQDTPLFIAESCAYANLIGGCPGKANCSFESMEMTSSHGERVTALDYHCRTIVLNQTAFCLGPRLAELRAAGARHLRADFVFRKYAPAEARAAWRAVRSGSNIPGGHAANFDRGIV